MKRLFKVGDKVRLIEAYAGFNVGRNFVVESFSSTTFGEGNRQAKQLLNLKNSENTRTQVFDFRVELLEEAVFNISTATDQELADEYRRLAAIRIPFKDELNRRGYKFTTPKGQSITFWNEVVISKTAKVTL